MVRLPRRAYRILAHVAALVGIYLVATTALFLGLQVSATLGTVGIVVAATLLLLYVYIGFFRKRGRRPGMPLPPDRPTGEAAPGEIPAGKDVRLGDVASGQSDEPDAAEAPARPVAGQATGQGNPVMPKPPSDRQKDGTQR